ncbi:PREDICTED: protein strawberry notch homolog 1-like [Acropora digitifera]|uniref:protein strawberry notch homolog 1-like n=1 Tax=Acropora digitifera TaxID=70779 RepID=UPI00077A49BE|nr:PREDICTED: protein strawberry notch homolog 1-like [Acropora digitifera]
MVPPPKDYGGNFLLDLGAHGEAVNDVSVQTFAGNSIFGTATTELHTVSVERGMSWEESLELRASKTYPDNGYYLSNQIEIKPYLEQKIMSDEELHSKNSMCVSVTKWSDHKNLVHS